MLISLTFGSRGSDRPSQLKNPFAKSERRESEESSTRHAFVRYQAPLSRSRTLASPRDLINSGAKRRWLFYLVRDQNPSPDIAIHLDASGPPAVSPHVFLFCKSTAPLLTCMSPPLLTSICMTAIPCDLSRAWLTHTYTWLSPVSSATSIIQSPPGSPRDRGRALSSPGHDSRLRYRIRRA